MSKVATVYDKSGEDQELAKDIRNLRDSINRQYEVIEIDARTSDPTAFETTSAKAYFWFRSDTNQLKVYINGSTKAVTLS